jgi:hypothetical protein
LVMGPSGRRRVRRTTSNPSTLEGPPASRHAVSWQRTRPATQAINGRRTGQTMAANQELTDRTPVFFVAASTGRTIQHCPFMDLTPACG